MLSVDHFGNLFGPQPENIGNKNTNQPRKKPSKRISCAGDNGDFAANRALILMTSMNMTATRPNSGPTINA